MKTAKILIKEHGLIVKFLNSLSLAKEQVENGQGPPEEFFLKAAEFSKRFIDEYHHYKEEYLMFGLLAQKKDGAIDRETGALRFQHERCRTFIDKIERSAEGYSTGNEIAITTLLENLASYVSILKRHIHIEDNVFFKMAEKELSEEEDNALLEQFHNEAMRLGGEEIFEKGRILVDKIHTLTA